MKLKKLALTITAGALLAGALTACGGDKNTTETTAGKAAATEAPADTAADTAEAGKAEAATGAYHITYNGIDLKTGMVWADVKDSLGSETKPMERIEPCGGGDYIQEMYFYDGVTINTLRSETIVGIEVPMDTAGDSALAAGQIKKGDSADKIKEVLGEPTREDEYQVVYESDTDSLFFFIDNGTITGFSIMTNPK